MEEAKLDLSIIGAVLGFLIVLLSFGLFSDNLKKSIRPILFILSFAAMVVMAVNENWIAAVCYLILFVWHGWFFIYEISKNQEPEPQTVQLVQYVDVSFGNPISQKPEKPTKTVTCKFCGAPNRVAKGSEMTECDHCHREPSEVRK